MNENYKHEPGFFPDDPIDGRKIGEWQTRYTDSGAKKAIRVEAQYLGVLLAVFLICLTLLLSGLLHDWLRLPDDTYQHFSRYVGAWLAASVGGTAYSIKWLIHAVGHGFWNSDRRLWRLFTPHVSGTLGIIVILIVESGLFGFFDPGATRNLSLVVALAFLSGYFSDRMIGKLSELFSNIFGPSDKHNKKEQ
jgi:hypothetical protein